MLSWFKLKIKHCNRCTLKLVKICSCIQNFVVYSSLRFMVHGDPTRNHHDWVICMHNNQQFLCHVLCFAFIEKIDEHINFPFGVVNEPEEYAVCHYVDQDVFCNEIPQAFLYSEGDFTSYRTDEKLCTDKGMGKVH